ncbi:hypothetical protein, partial [Enorma phocaeensis]|uniref:hypothetical protein n=1 Tax=Enorma phocaeensis TaxID=1871019 RepID=UPI00195A7893
QEERPRGEPEGAAGPAQEDARMTRRDVSGGDIFKKLQQVFLRSLQDGGAVESYLGAFDACRRISFHEVPEHSGLADLSRAGQDNDFEMFGISAN